MGRNIEKNFVLTYDKHYKLLQNYIYFRVSSFEVSEDIAQEAFLKTWVYLNKENSEVRDYKNFIYKVAKNLIIDHYKDKEKNLEIPIDIVNPLELRQDHKMNDSIDNKLLMKYLTKTINEMEIKYKKIITYRYIKQMSIDDICDKTEMSHNHVSVIIHRGLKVLKENIKKELRI